MRERAGERFDSFADGSIRNILFRSAKIAIANAANFNPGIFTSPGRIMGQLLPEAVKNAVLMFQSITTGALKETLN